MSNRTVPAAAKGLLTSTDAAQAASTALNAAIDQLGYSVNDMRMFASLLDTITQLKLAMEGDSDLLRPGVKGLHLAPIEAEEICFLVLKVDHMARTVDDQFERLVAAVSEARAS